MKILMHICCAPCSIYPLDVLRREGWEIMGYFFKNNIHPYTECLKRQDTLEKYSDTIDLKVIYQDGYDLEGFIRGVAYREANRCEFCYHERLKSTALLAKRGKFDYFTTALLYSKYQKHNNFPTNPWDNKKDVKKQQANKKLKNHNRTTE